MRTPCEIKCKMKLGFLFDFGFVLTESCYVVQVNLKLIM